MALAVTSTTALAQESFTQIYGTLNVDVERVEARGAVPPRNRVTQNSSNLGFRGEEKIGGGLAAIWQIESGVAVDAGGSSIASRNTAVGLKGGWGSLRLGQWDTPYKVISGITDPMYFTGITYTGALIGTPGFGVGPVTIGAPGASSANASFERRQGNSVQYWSPAFAGATFRFAYSANESRTANLNPQIFSGSLEYERGFFSLGYAHERHQDYFGADALVPAAQATPVTASASSRDDGDKLVARVKVGRTQVGIMSERLRYARSFAAAVPIALSHYERDAYALTLIQGIGASGTIRALVGKARDGKCSRFDGTACSTAGLGARQLSLGYSHTLSKRTDLYAFYTKVDNDERATYQFANGAGIGAPAGAASIGYVLGIRHVF
jgi:predicted porin